MPALGGPHSSYPVVNRHGPASTCLAIGSGLGKAGGMDICKSPKWAVIARGVFGAALAFTIVLALLPAPPALPVETGDKVMHMIAFAVLSLLAFLSFPKRRIIELFAWMAVLGSLIEVLQMIPALHRDAEFADWVVDCAASLVVLILCRTVRWLFASRAA